MGVGGGMGGSEIAKTGFGGGEGCLGAVQLGFEGCEAGDDLMR